MTSAKEIEYKRIIKELEAKLKSQEKVIVQKDNLLVLKQQQLIEKDNLLIKKQNQINDLLVERTKLNKKIVDLTYDKQNKANQIKRDAYNEFFSKNEQLHALLKKSRTVKEKSNRKRGRPAGSVNFKDLQDLEPDEIIILEPTENVNFNNKDAYINIGTDRTLKIEKIPARYKLVAYDRPKYKGINTNKIFQFRSDFAFGNSIITPSFVANAISLKYELSMPVTKISKYISNEMNISISKQNWCNYFEKAAELLKPLYDKLEYELLHNEAKAVHFDETFVSLSKGEEDRIKNYMLVGTSTYATEQIAYYKFIGTRSFKDLSIFKEYEGTIICDAYSSYFSEANKNPNIKIQSCLVHARRRFADCIKANLSNKKIEEILILINKIFDIESFKINNDKKKITAQEVIDIRNSEERPIFKKIKDLCEQSKNSKIELLSTACNYFLNHYDTLTTYLDNAILPCHNNKAERVVGAFVDARSNFQTIVNEIQAQNSAIIFTIVQTAKLNNLNVEAYLKDILNDLYHNVNPTNLLPWNKEIKKKYDLNKRKDQA